MWRETNASIEDHQGAFARALLWQSDELPADVLGPRVAARAKRFTIYRNNVFASLTGCLAARFPVVARLVGEDFFAAMAKVFIADHPPLSPALFEYGEEFPHFLSTFEPARALPYLSDVARLEWMLAAAYHAADAQPIAATKLGRFGDDALDSSLMLHPSCAILISDYPVLSLWHTNTHDEIVRPIDVSAGGEAALVVRPKFDVALIGIDTPTFAFIRALAAGHSLELSAEAAAALDSEFEFAAALATLFRASAVIDVRPQERQFDRTQSPAMRMNQCEI